MKYMKKFVFAYYCLFIANLVAITQALEVRTIEVSQYNLGSDYEPLYEGHWGGPGITITFLLINNSPEELLLSMDYDSVELSFKHDYKNYIKFTTVRFPFNDKSTILYTNDSITIKAGTNILYGTDLFRKSGEDYRATLLQVLPTLSVVYYVSSSSLIIGDRNKINVILKE